MFLEHPIIFAIMAGALILSISIHEFAHALMADKLGDPTPRINDRLTLNPKAHLDTMGTISLLILGFGWGKPVPVDIYNLRNPKRDYALISLAGPLSNIILAIISIIVAKLIPIAAPIATLVAYFSIGLAVFNLIPIYPLDGQKILTGILPNDWAIEFEEIMHQYGSIILIFLIWPFSGQSLISRIIGPIIDVVFEILTSIL